MYRRVSIELMTRPSSERTVYAPVVTSVTQDP